MLDLGCLVSLLMRQISDDSFIFQIFSLWYTNSFLQNRYVADCNDFSVQVFSLTKRCTATLSISFRRATPILCGSIPFFPLKCMCVEKSVHECTLVVIVSINVRKSYYFSREVTNPCNDFSGSLFSLNNKVTPIMMVDLPNAVLLYVFSVLLWGMCTKTRVTSNYLSGVARLGDGF